MVSKGKTNKPNCPVDGVYLHDGIITREANLLQYKETEFVNKMLLMRTLNWMSIDQEKMDIALNYENGKLIVIDTINPQKRYNKTFFNKVGTWVKIGSYDGKKMSPELEKFLKDNPKYKSSDLIKSLTAPIHPRQ